MAETVYLNTREAAAHLGLSARTLDRYRVGRRAGVPELPREGERSARWSRCRCVRAACRSWGC